MTMTTTMTTLLTTTAIINNTTTTTPVVSTNSTSETPYDAEGAMKFTVAVVLVFGIGVIGLLGIYHRRNISQDLSDKEADEFVKRFERKRYNIEKQYRKKLMLNLVGSFFSKRILRSQNENEHRVTMPSLRPTQSEPNLHQCQSLLCDWKHDTVDQEKGYQKHKSDQSDPANQTLSDLKAGASPKKPRSKSFQFTDVEELSGPISHADKPRQKRADDVSIQQKNWIVQKKPGKTGEELCVLTDEVELSVLVSRSLSRAEQTAQPTPCSSEDSHSPPSGKAGGTDTGKKRSVLVVPRILIDDLFD